MTFRSSAATALVVGLGVALAGCGKMNEVRAMKAFKDGNKLYAANDYREAAEKYEEAIQLDPEDNINSCGASPGCVYFYLANSYQKIYPPTRKGDPNNDAYL
jgi:tetratricopeptide (TPR) repeat protein